MNLVTKSKIKSSDAISDLRTTTTLKGAEACDSKSGITSKITNNYTSDFMSSSLNSKTKAGEYPQANDNYSMDQYQIFMSEFLNYSLNKDLEAYHTFNGNLDMNDGHKLIDIHQIELYHFREKSTIIQNQINSSVNQQSMISSSKSEARDLANLKVAQTSESASLSKNFAMQLNLSGQKLTKKYDSKLKVHFSPNHKVKEKSQPKLKKICNPPENLNSEQNLLTCSAATDKKGNKCSSNLLSQISSSLSLKQYQAKQAKSNEGGSEDLNNLKSKVKQYKNSIPTNIKSTLTSNLVNKISKPITNKSMQQETDFSGYQLSKLKTSAISNQLIPLGKHHKSRAKDSSSQLYSSVNARPDTRGSGQKSQTKTFN